MAKELRIPHEAIADSQTITDEMEARFREVGLDLHRHEVESLEDDWKNKERVLRIKTTRYHFL